MRSRASTRIASCVASLGAIAATLRTNYYQTDGKRSRSRAGCPSSSTPRNVPELPQPRPAFEIFVYSPRVEGVHLRMGHVARGGIRWSDRREDFRTEVLGLMKAQNVKNTVIVPVGAKGGFVPKRLPANASREDVQREGVECYRTFIRGLLDLTDNIVDGKHRAAAAGRASRRRRSLPRGRRRQGHGDVLGHRQPHLRRIRLLARRCVRLRRFGGLRPQEDGHHGARRMGMRASATSARSASTRSRRTSPRSASATWPATCSATACCSHRTLSCSRRSITSTSSSTRHRMRARASRSASVCSRCRARPGRTTTAS